MCKILLMQRYRNQNCKGTGFSFNTAGTKQLPDWIDNKAKSWKCVDANQ